MYNKKRRDVIDNMSDRPVTFTELEQKFIQYERSECDGGRVLSNYFGGFSKQTAFPGRCNAAREYVKSLREFIKETKDTTEKSVESDKERLIRRIQNEEHKQIYPLLNHDYDYATSVKKMYNPYTLNITNQPTMGGLEGGIKGSRKYLDAMIRDRFPHENAVAGITDVYTENGRKNKIVELTRKEDAKLPYPSFRKDYPECMYPTKGEYSSSYFARVGKCPTKIKDKDVCIKKGYEWIDEEKPPAEINKFLQVKSNEEITGENAPASDATPPPPPPPKGTCFKPRFIYVNNRADGIGSMNGIVPSSLSDIRAIAPDRLMTVMQGYTVAGSGLLPCTEEFTSGNVNVGINKVTPSSPLSAPSRMSFLLGLLAVAVVVRVVVRVRPNQVIR